MPKNKDVLIIGYFGFQTNQLDGQTIKTREIYRLVKEKSNTLVSFYDTQEFKQNKLSIYRLFKMLLCHDTIIYLPGRNNLKKLFPIIYFIIRAKKSRLIFIAVGGWLNEFIHENKGILNKIQYSNVILVESKSLQKKLILDHGLKQAKFFPNFRFHDFSPKTQSGHDQGKVIKIVFMARITEAKGIYKIFDLIEYLNQKKLKKEILFDFYGPVDHKDEIKFFNLLKKSPTTNYKGIVQPMFVHSTLANYDILLLPTHYEGEGFPGTILDSYIAGIPVIVSNWKFLSEYVDHEKTGFIYNNISEFHEYSLYLINNIEELQRMKKNALAKSREFSLESAWHILQEYL